MGKADFLSPKAIGNRIKSKGLQKLRWYCQMCQKQCRDEVKHRAFSVIFRSYFNIFNLFCISFVPEWLQMPLHVRVPPEAASAGLRRPKQIHGLLLRVSSFECKLCSMLMLFFIWLELIPASSLRSEFKNEFLELLRRRFGES